jgi:hypothetical protein
LRYYDDSSLEEDIAIVLGVVIDDCDININGLEFYASKDKA